MFFNLFRKKPQPDSTPYQPLGFTALVISDTHGEPVELPLIAPDVAFFLGDIPYFTIQELDKKLNCPKYGVLGNHDGLDYLDGTSVIHVHEKVVQFRSIKISGFDGCLRYNSKPNLQFTEEEAGKFMDPLEYVDIFLAHSNPCFNPQEKHIAHKGFQAFTHYIERNQPHYFLHGHLHTNDKKQIGKTKIQGVSKIGIIQL